MRLVLSVLFAAAAFAQPQPSANPPSKPRLVYAVVLSRHGVRSPTSPGSALQQYAASPWPAWDAAPGELTAHGAKALTALGAWYRDWFAQDKLLTATGCDSAAAVHVRADLDQRTRASARAFLEGMFPGCAVTADTVAGDVDPLFHSASAGLVHADPAASIAAVSAKLGGRPGVIPPSLAPAFQTLREILFACAASAPCPAASQPGKQDLLTLPASVAATEDGLADVRGPLRTGSTLAENLLLEYTGGKTGSDLGWGRLDETKLTAIMAIHTVYADIARRTQAIARPQGSNLLSHVLRSMEQAVAHKEIPGALGSPGGRLLLLAGHDTNISHLSGMLNLTWQLPGYQRDDTPPGGSLIFRLWQAANGDYSVDALYIAQTMNQIRAATPLTGDAPPVLAHISIPGCTASGSVQDCDWEVFRHVASQALDSKSISPN